MEGARLWEGPAAGAGPPKGRLQRARQEDGAGGGAAKERGVGRRPRGAQLPDGGCRAAVAAQGKATLAGPPVAVAGCLPVFSRAAGRRVLPRHGPRL